MPLDQPRLRALVLVGRGEIGTTPDRGVLHNRNHDLPADEFAALVALHRDQHITLPATPPRRPPRRIIAQLTDSGRQLLAVSAPNISVQEPEKRPGAPAHGGQGRPS